MFDINSYKGKKVFVTGHTGFKGAWLCKVLTNYGAEVTGYALDPPTEPSLYRLADLERDVRSVIGDIRDKERLAAAIDEAKPDIVFHLAAQPIVRESYIDPVTTYETNILGTVNILECIRRSDSVRSFLNVTTDKVYLNNESGRAYKEDDALDGFDPYSNSKSCSEIITHSYDRSFLKKTGIAVSTARAGNVIGGGDFGADRIVPDCVRAAIRGEAILLRHPDSVRPYQHVLEAIYAYLMIASMQYQDAKYAGWYNVGPDDSDCISTGELADKFSQYWGEILSIRSVDAADDEPHEAGLLRLDCTKLKETFGWKPLWDIDKAVAATVEWSKCMTSSGDIRSCMDSQIKQYVDAANTM